MTSLLQSAETLPRKRAWGNGEELTLDDGRSVIIRPVRPLDAGPTRSFIEYGLSSASRRRRFHGAIRSLPPAKLAAMTAVDQIDHVALVAVMAASVESNATPFGTTVIVAEARYVIEAPGDQAEVALAVADAWQGVGLGAAMLSLLCRQGRLSGLLGLRADVMADNVAMLALLRTRGSQPCKHPDDATLRRLWVPTGGPDFPVEPRNRAVVASTLGGS
jgi:acetyltransferase